VPAEQARKQRAALFVAAPLHDRRRDIGQPDRVQRRRRTGAVPLFGPDDLLEDASTASPVFLGPGDRGVPGLGQRPGPRAHPLEPFGIERPPRATKRADVIGEVHVEPRAKFRAERLGFRWIREVHERMTLAIGPVSGCPQRVPWRPCPPDAIDASASACLRAFSSTSSAVVFTTPSTLSSPMTCVSPSVACMYSPP